MSGNWPFHQPPNQDDRSPYMLGNNVPTQGPSSQDFFQPPQNTSQQHGPRGRPNVPFPQRTVHAGFPPTDHGFAQSQRPVSYYQRGISLDSNGHHLNGASLGQQSRGFQDLSGANLGLDDVDRRPLGNRNSFFMSAVPTVTTTSAFSSAPSMLSTSTSSSASRITLPPLSSLPLGQHTPHYANLSNRFPTPQVREGSNSLATFHERPTQNWSPFFVGDAGHTPATRPTIQQAHSRHRMQDLRTPSQRTTSLHHPSNHLLDSRPTPAQSSSSPTVAGSSSPTAEASLRRKVARGSCRPLPGSNLSSTALGDSQILELPHAPPIANGIELINPGDVIPDKFRDVFPYRLFNAVQSKCFEAVYESNDNVVISAPTASGKTAILELSICRLAHRRGNENFKIVYLAPIKALCQERATDWRAKFQTLGMEVAELTGDTSRAEMVRVRQATILVTTPEKWDSITRSWTDHRKLLDMVELFLIDEVHILKESRGSTVEAVVSRMKTHGANVRFIALSATIPNPDDIARWLGKDRTNRHMPARQEMFGEEFRPVRLQKFVYGFDRGINDFQFDKFLDGQLYPNIAKHSQKKPILVFCQTRKSCESTATRLAEEWNTERPGGRVWPEPKNRIAVVSSELQEVVRYGVAFHHAGLDLQDRQAVEQAFSRGDLSVICCTSTLAMGVNLPCHMVVLKGTVSYQEGQLQELSDLEVMQMLGRAGRPQFGQNAVAIILTRARNKRRYEDMVSGQQILESTLHQNLIEHLNSEISLGTFQDIEKAKSWLKGTFLSVRLSRNPGYYRLTERSSDTQALDDKLEDICETDISKLREAGLITPEATFHSTEYGRAMSKFMIRFNTMKKILEIPRGATMEQVLHTLCEAEEFRDLRWKADERGAFRDLNRDNFIVYPIRQNVNTTAHKISLLIQTTLGCVDMSNVPPKVRRSMTVDTRLVLDIMRRLVRAAIECKASELDGVTVRVALELERSMAAKAWEGRPMQLIQVAQIGPVVMRKLVSSNIKTVHALADTDSGTIERVVSRNPPFGKKVVDELALFPRLTLQARITANKPRKVSANQKPLALVDATLGFANTKGRPKWRNKIPFVTFVAETTEGTLAYFWRGSLKKFKEEDGNKTLLHFEVELSDVTGEIICHLSCEEIVGTIVSQTLKPQLPAAAFPPKPKPLPQSSDKSRFDHQGAQSASALLGLDDDINDDDMLQLLQEGADGPNKNREDTAEDGENGEDYDQWPLMDRAGNIQAKAPQAKKKRQRKPSEPEDEEDTTWQPVRLSNGKWKCNHTCSGDGLTTHGKSCSHKCCREGIDKPRKPRSKRKTRNDEVEEVPATQLAKYGPPTKRAKVSESSGSRLQTSILSPVRDLSQSSSLHASYLMDLDGFNLDDDDLIDLTQIDGTLDDGFVDDKGSSVPGHSQFQTNVNGGSQKSAQWNPCNQSNDDLLDGVFDDDFEDYFVAPFGRSINGNGNSKTFDKGQKPVHAQLQKQQNNSTDEFSGDSLFDEPLVASGSADTSLGKGKKSVYGQPSQTLNSNPKCATKADPVERGLRAVNDSYIFDEGMSRLSHGQSSPSSLFVSDEGATLSNLGSRHDFHFDGIGTERTELEDPKPLGLHLTSSSDSNREKRTTREREHGALSLLADDFVDDTVQWDAIPEEVPALNCSFGASKTPKDDDSMIVQTPRDGNARPSGDGHDSQQQQHGRQGEPEWVNEFDPDFINEFRGLVEFI